MTDHSKKLSYENAGYISGKMVNDLSPKKTLLVLVIVVGCFAVLWPKVFYPMLVGSVNNRIKPSPIDRTQGCCDVLLEKDVTTIKLMSEICNTIIRQDSDNPLSNKELISKCQNAVLDTCGIDISAVLQEQVRLGHTTKHILEEIRSLNGSLCLKYNFGVAPWKLGVPHRITVKVSPSYTIRQERPLHLRSEMVHPAFRERGRAIPQAESFSPTKPSPPSRLISKVVEGRPGPIPGMRPTIGGAGHVVPPSKHGGNSMGLIMPIYTIGIVVFFTYTVMKIIFKKQPEVLYPPVEPDPHFKREVFEADRGHAGSRVSKDGVSSKIVVNAMSALLDEVDLELSSRRKPSEVDQQDVVANGSVPNQEDDQGSVQVLGMETTASYEGGQKWIRPDSPLLPVSHSPPPVEPETVPQEIFLEGSLPPQSHLLVTDSATEAQKTEHEEDPAVVLAGKMTLSVISLDSTENGTDESSSSSKKHEERSSSNISEEFEKIDVSQLEKQIEDILEVQAASSERDISNETSQESINIDFCEPKNKISEEDLASLQLDSLNSFREEPINSGNTDSMDKLLVQPKSFENIDDIVQDLLNRDFTEPNEVSMVQPISLKQENQNETKQELLDTEYREPNETVSILQSTSIERDNLENIEQELLSTSYTEENNDIKQESLTTEDLGMNRKDSEIQLEPAVTELDENINAESLVVEKEECPSKELEENILSSEKVRENLDDIEQELLSTAYTEENNDIRQESLTTEDLGMHRKDSEIQLEPAVTELDKNINAESLVVEKEECPSKELEENILSSEKVLPIKLAAKSSNDKIGNERGAFSKTTEVYFNGSLTKQYRNSMIVAKQWTENQGGPSRLSTTPFNKRRQGDSYMPPVKNPAIKKTYDPIKSLPKKPITSVNNRYEPIKSFPKQPTASVKNRYEPIKQSARKPITSVNNRFEPIKCFSKQPIPSVNIRYEPIKSFSKQPIIAPVKNRYEPIEQLAKQPITSVNNRYEPIKSFSKQPITSVNILYEPIKSFSKQPVASVKNRYEPIKQLAKQPITSVNNCYDPIKSFSKQPIAPVEDRLVPLPKSYVTGVVIKSDNDKCTSDTQTPVFVPVTIDTQTMPVQFAIMKNVLESIETFTQTQLHHIKIESTKINTVTEKKNPKNKIVVLRNRTLRATNPNSDVCQSNDSDRNSVEIVPEEIEYVSDAEEDSGEEEEVEEEEELVEEEEEIEVEEEEEDENEDIEEM